jgi:hypothetical protein
MQFYLPNTTDPTYIKSLRKLILPFIQNYMGTCKQITILVLYQASSTLVNLVNYSFIYIYSFSYRVLQDHWFYLNDIPFFFPEMSTSFMSYIVHIIPIHLTQIL